MQRHSFTDHGGQQGRFKIIELPTISRPIWMPRSLWRRILPHLHTVRNTIPSWESAWMNNKIMKGTNTGVNLIAQRLIGSLTYDIEITTAEIGTGSTAPVDGDTNLETPVTTGILRALQSVDSVNIAHLEFFIPSDDLANGTYNEFGLRAGAQLYARAIFAPAYTKSAGQDTKVVYEITTNNS